MLVMFEITPASEQGFLQQYIRLHQWDSKWYENIAQNGYFTHGLPTVRTSLDPRKENIAFFPGYPLTGRLVQLLTGLPMTIALLFAAQLACWGMCTYIFLLLERWNVSAPMIGVTFALIFSYPSAFFLVSSHSESLFYCMILGCMYWQHRHPPLKNVPMLIHGVVMTATRVPGMALTLYPFFCQLGKKYSKTFVCTNIVASGIMMCGGLLFFLYCAIQFNNWDIYFDTQKIGWGIIPNYAAIFSIKTYQLHLLTALRPLSIHDLSLLSIPLATAWFLLLILTEAVCSRTRKLPGQSERFGLYFCAFSIFFLSISGVASAGMISIMRHLLGVHILLVLATMHLLHSLSVPQKTLHCIAFCFCLLSFLMLKMHVVAANIFMSGNWI